MYKHQMHSFKVQERETKWEKHFLLKFWISEKIIWKIHLDRWPILRKQLYGVKSWVWIKLARKTLGEQTFLNTNGDGIEQENSPVGSSKKSRSVFICFLEEVGGERRSSYQQFHHRFHFLTLPFRPNIWKAMALYLVYFRCCSSSYVGLQLGDGVEEESLDQVLHFHVKR